MTVLVTGASGFLGSRVVQQLCAAGSQRIRCFVRPNSNLSTLDHLRHQYPSAALEYVVGNLLCPSDAFRATRGVDVVYHLAAEMRGGPATLFANTVVASRNLLEGIVQQGVPRVVLVGSIAAYGVAQLPRATSVTEETELEATPEKRDAYCFAKVRQELLFRQYRSNHTFELVILRSGVIYGEAGNTLPSRLGFHVGPVFLQIAASNRLPLTYVENCADAVVLAGQTDALPEGIYNVVDDDLPTSSEYLQMYRVLVGRLPSLYVPVFLASILSRGIEHYHNYSKGQIPLFLTRYRVRSVWRGHTYSNRKLKSMGWRQGVPTGEALARSLEYFSRKTSPSIGMSTMLSHLDRRS